MLSHRGTVGLDVSPCVGDPKCELQQGESRWSIHGLYFCDCESTEWYLCHVALDLL